MFENEIEEELRKRGGRMRKKEINQLFGGRHRMKNEDLQDMYKELKRGNKINVGKKELSLEDLI